jgi:hypothetical protein
MQSRPVPHMPQSSAPPQPLSVIPHCTPRSLHVCGRHMHVVPLLTYGGVHITSHTPLDVHVAMPPVGTGHGSPHPFLHPIAGSSMPSATHVPSQRCIPDMQGIPESRIPASGLPPGPHAGERSTRRRAGNERKAGRIPRLCGLDGFPNSSR